MKTRTPESRTIEGFEVTTTRLPVQRALKLAPKVMKIMVPFLPLAPLVQGSVNLTDVDMDDLASVVANLLGSLDDATVDLLCRELLAETTIIMPDEHDRLVVCDLNTAQLVDIAFGGLENGISVLAQVLLFAGEVNFKRSFFDLVRKVGVRKAAPADSATKPSA